MTFRENVYLFVESFLQTYWIPLKTRIPLHFLFSSVYLVQQVLNYKDDSV